MLNITLCDVSELEDITGLTHDELWDKGFNLDDCDAVMILDADALPLKQTKDEFGYSTWSLINDLWSLYYEEKIDPSLFEILNDWENYCVGARYVKYNDKIYVSKHHA